MALLFSSIVYAQTAEPSGGLASTQTDAGAVQVYSLQQLLDMALAKGNEIKSASAILESAKLQTNLAESKAGFSLSANAGYNYEYGFGPAFTDPALSAAAIAALGTSEGSSQVVQGGLTLAVATANPTAPGTKFTLGVTQTIPPDVPTKKPMTVGTFSVGQTLWDGYAGGQTLAAIRKSRLTSAGANLTFAATRSGIFAKVKQAYYIMLAAQRNLSLRKDISANQQSLLTQITAIYEIKQATQIDLLTAQANAKSAQIDLDAAQHDFDVARTRLAILLGMDTTSAFSIAETGDPEPPVKTLDESIATGLAKRSDAAGLALNIESASIDLLLAKGLGQPGVSLSGGAEFGAASGDFPKYAADVNVGVKVSMPILDAGASALSQKAVSQQIAALTAQRKSLVATITADITDNYWKVQMQAQRVEVAKLSMDVYQKKLALSKVQRDNGTATNQDLLSASVDAANAQVAWLTAKTNYFLAELTLETAMGL